MTDHCLHASDLQLTNWRGQEIGKVIQVLDPGVDVSDKCVVAYPADEVPGVEVDTGAYGVTFDAEIGRAHV